MVLKRYSPMDKFECLTKMELGESVAERILHQSDVIELLVAALKDSEPVVRCNMCKYYEKDTGFCQYFGTGNCWDGFCNKGARMDGEDNE